jgi:hypothetical protein
MLYSPLKLRDVPTYGKRRMGKGPEPEPIIVGNPYLMGTLRFAYPTA